MFENVKHDDEVEQRRVPDRGEIAHEHGHVRAAACGGGGRDAALAPDREPTAFAERAKHPARAAAELERDTARRKSRKPPVDTAEVKPPKDECRDRVESPVTGWVVPIQ